MLLPVTIGIAAAKIRCCSGDSFCCIRMLSARLSAKSYELSRSSQSHAASPSLSLGHFYCSLYTPPATQLYLRPRCCYISRYLLVFDWPRYTPGHGGLRPMPIGLCCRAILHCVRAGRSALRRRRWRRLSTADGTATLDDKFRRLLSVLRPWCAPVAPWHSMSSCDTATMITTDSESNSTHDENGDW